MRGENLTDDLIDLANRGSPPLARGKLLTVVRHFVARRITPACAGKTSYLQTEMEKLQDHPRLRGENHSSLFFFSSHRGSPPLARGKRVYNSAFPSLIGITPACAGKTYHDDMWHGGARDHPRLRGENLSIFTILSTLQGSPPLARGKPRGESCLAPRTRITPACAGKTALQGSCACGAWDHPRLRGENQSLLCKQVP